MNATDLQELMGAFLTEAQEFLQTLETEVLHLETAQDPQARQQPIKALFRAAHSLKGSALMFSMGDLADAAHKLEDCFGILRDHPPEFITPEISTDLLQGVDFLKLLTAQGSQPDPGTVSQAKEHLLALKRELDRLVPAIAVAPVAAAANQDLIAAIFEHELPPVLAEMLTQVEEAQAETLPHTVDRLLSLQQQLASTAALLQVPRLGALAAQWHHLLTGSELSVSQLQNEGLLLLEALQELQAAPFAKPNESTLDAGDPLVGTDILGNMLDGILETIPSTDPPSPDLLQDLVNVPLNTSLASPQQRPTIRVDVQQLTELVNLVGELVINRTRLELQETQLRSEARRMRRGIRSLQENGGNLRQDYDRLSIPQVSQQRWSPTGQSASSGFDALEWDQYSEFHTTAQQMIETTQILDQSAAQIDTLGIQLETSLDHLQRITDQLRRRVMQLRLIPFGRVVDHLPRAIRDLSRTYNKDVNLLLLGRETQIDDSLLEALKDPLLHLVRNAFDHGIESPQHRLAAGKTSSGQIEIEARQQGGQTVITVRDDGQGIDPQRIRQKLISSNLMPAEQVQTLSLNELYDCLFAPGFSTADQVTALSGRGVGLDVVRTNLQQIRGTIRVDSQLGLGTVFTLKLPLQLSIIPALLIETEGQKLAIPMDAIEEILHIEMDHIQRVGSRPMIGYRDEFLRLISLSEILNYRTLVDAQEAKEVPVLILTTNDRLVSVRVDRLLGQQEVVLKPIPDPLPKPFGIVGSTILGTGEVVLVLDVDTLGEEGTTHSSLISSSMIPEKPAVLPTHRLPSVLVVDDTYSIRQLLSRTLLRANYQVIEAKDGQDALDQLHRGITCDFILTDLEMPRLDGFDLIRALKSDPQLQSIPVAVLTSRSANKHRELAISLGARHYFTKPYQEAELVQVVGQLIRI